MTTYNPLATQIALEQNVEIGSQAWIDGGLQAFSGQTGGHPAYGWRRTETMNGSRVRAVIANYAARGCWYDAEENPRRESGYRIGGRPEGWTPEDELDQPNGERTYLGPNGFVNVSGPDWQHFWIDPLFDVVDRAPDSLRVATPWGRVSAPALARTLSTMLVDTFAGMLRKHGPWNRGGRSAARAIDTFVQAQNRGLVSLASAVAFVDWLETYCLPFLESAPGVVDAKGVGICNIYQDVSWVLPAVYDAEKLFRGPRPDLASRLATIRNRLCRWTLDLDAIKGGVGAWSHFDLTPAVLAGEDGKPLESLVGAIGDENVHGPEWYGDWHVRAAEIVTRVLPGETSNEYFARVYDAAKDSQYAGTWLVDADREFLS